MSDCSTFLGPKICEELGNKTLKILVLRNAEGDVEKAKNNISIIRNFINNFESYLSKKYKNHKDFRIQQTKSCNNKLDYRFHIS